MVRNLSTTEFGMFITNVRLGLGSAGGVFSSNNYEFRDSAGTSAFLTINGGNVLINTTTDAGFKLDVNGTARVQDLLTVATGTTKGILFGGTKIVEVTNDPAYTQLAIQPSSGNKAGVFQFAPSGTANASVMEFYSSSAFNATLRFIFKNTNGVLQIGSDAAALPTTFITNNIEAARFSTTRNFLIGTTTDVASSKLTIESTTQGFLPPRMTTTQKNAIATPATGLMVYDTTLNLISVYNGTIWISL
jgi:hypothetical protein